MSKITYDNKVATKPQGVRINQFWDADANEIKTVVNEHDDRIEDLELVDGEIVEDNKKAVSGETVYDYIEEYSLRGKISLAIGNSGYVKYEDSKVLFSYLYLIDSESGKRIYLNDGVNAYNIANEIQLATNDSIYFLLSDFINATANTEVSLSTKSWTTLTKGDKAVGFALSITDETKMTGDIFSMCDKTYLYEKIDEIDSTILGLDDYVKLDNEVPSDSRLDTDTTTDGAAAGEWDIRFSTDANNFIEKLTDEAEDYFKVSIDTSGGSNPALWMVNYFSPNIENKKYRLEFDIKGDAAGAININANGNVYGSSFTEVWSNSSQEVEFGTTYSDVRLMLYKTSAIIFYIKNIKLIPYIAESINEIEKADYINELNTPVLQSAISQIKYDGVGVCNIGISGDSWVQGVGVASAGYEAFIKYLTRALWDKYGYAGIGWFDFGRSNGTAMECADDEAVGYGRSGTFTDVAIVPESLGVTFAHTVMTATAYHQITMYQGRGCDNAVIWFYNDAHFEYRIDGGVYVEVQADSVSGWQSIILSEPIEILRIRAIDNDCIVFGVDLGYGDTGVKVHKLGCRGIKTTDAVLVDETNYKQGISKLDLDFFANLMFTNDRSSSINPATVSENTQTLLGWVKEAYSNIIDTAVICPSNTEGGTGSYTIEDYTDSLRSYCSENKIPFTSLLPVFGSVEQITALGTFYDSLHPSKRGGYMISEFLYKVLFNFDI